MSGRSGKGGKYAIPSEATTKLAPLLKPEQQQIDKKRTSNIVVKGRPRRWVWFGTG
jgi:hypothetical protein